MDMRTHLAALEDRDLLHRVTEPVSAETEISPISRWVYHGYDDPDRFAIRFEDVAGFEYPVVTLALGASSRAYALALGVDHDPDAIHERWRAALDEPLDPRVVTDAPCQSAVAAGEDASLRDLPIPTWTPRKDPGPYVTALVITKDRATGVQNMATYRCYVKGDRRIAINLNPGRHGYRTWQSYAEHGEPAPAAIAIAAAPAAHLSGIANVPYGVDEATIAGGLLDAPLGMTPAETVNLRVPATAEFVIEGEIDPEELTAEGPFGEFAGYMSGHRERPVLTVTAITHREDPFFYGYLSQMPPSESTTIQSLSNASIFLKRLHDLGYESVRDLHIDRTFGGNLAHGLLQLEPQYGSHAAEVGQVLANVSTLKRVTVVDLDVDIRDPTHVDWALNSRYNPERDTHMIGDVDLVTDPSAERDNRGRSVSSKVVRDATVALSVDARRPVRDVPALSIPPRDLMEAARDRWPDLGLPGLEPKRRMALMLEHHPGPEG